VSKQAPEPSLQRELQANVENQIRGRTRLGPVPVKTEVKKAKEEEKVKKRAKVMALSLSALSSGILASASSETNAAIAMIPRIPDGLVKEL